MTEGAADAATRADECVEKAGARFTECLGPFAPKGEPFALVDFPDHYNVGDSAIYAGELAFFDRQVGRPADYVSSLSTYRADIDPFCPEGVVFHHGGGNFGDVWPRHHEHRLDVIRRYRHRKIVQLPQTLHFSSESARDETARAIADHPDYTLMVRDEASLDLARLHFDCETILCPDAAYNLRRLKADRAPDRDVIVLLRKDHEAPQVDLGGVLSAYGEPVDWKSPNYEARPMLRLAFERLVSPRFPKSRALMALRERSFRLFAARLVRWGVNLIGRARFLISDRLHAHIIASLMRMPHIALDNSYGKIGSYIAAWGDDGLATLASGPEDLKAALAVRLHA